MGLKAVWATKGNDTKGFIPVVIVGFISVNDVVKAVCCYNDIADPLNELGFTLFVEDLRYLKIVEF